ncbi:hypothetical protein PtrSN002B_003965 [Pyrenophora tritici-repentis]|uniref:Uncharacterized protein n=1 Tax=Pyrenophora tritici-repentis TaxID=45151 RepID=A0A2W1DGU3_9PLEO|nr:hypothetical protein PtrV1_12066 [Pyrenophora tritici-repentis]KAF7444857.1 hypothetical protein A1F99_114100 [Pyrenophora tritici-repentis]KAF7564219.1 hypothetical protein PtrM4_153680 [Pyrenophora tritici-repentis]KAG9379095.1 hypothetical protein A1F94_010864 [Pyrenophora tritici-repentis]KAI0580612.1 hypothetical protein Alg215_05104 [Pyrenophora tritici-repentis]
MPLLSITTTGPSLGAYSLLSPYSDDDTAFAHNTLCPRYAELDPTSAPPSPASIESFEILDSIPWRRGYISLDTPARRGSTTLLERWMRNKLRAIAMLFLVALAVAGCILGGYHLAVSKASKSNN